MIIQRNKAPIESKLYGTKHISLRCAEFKYKLTVFREYNIKGISRT